MDDVVARLSSEGERFLEDLEEDGSVEIRENEVILAWYDEFERMIYNRVYPNNRIGIGIMLVNQNLSGSVDFLEKQLQYGRPETASSIWDFCYETASHYGSGDLETYQSGTVL